MRGVSWQRKKKVKKEEDGVEVLSRLRQPLGVLGVTNEQSGHSLDALVASTTSKQFQSSFKN